MSGGCLKGAVQEKQQGRCALPFSTNTNLPAVLSHRLCARLVEEGQGAVI